MAKIVNLFDGAKVIQNTGVKYSDLLMQLMDSFKKDLEKMDDFEEIVDFTIDIWNLSNHKILLPEEDNKKHFDEIIKNHFSGKSGLAKKMIDYRIKNFKEHTNFIGGFEIDESGPEPTLKVISQDKETYLANMFEQMEEENIFDGSFDNEVGFINRSAIVLTPLKPFFDWLDALYPGDDSRVFEESKIYLVNEDILNLEAWLKKNYDNIFKQELYSFHVDDKKWPQKRTYKMFNQWFDVAVSTSIFDMEEQPVFKI